MGEKETEKPARLTHFPFEVKAFLLSRLLSPAFARLMLYQLLRISNVIFFMGCLIISPCLLETLSMHFWRFRPVIFLLLIVSFTSNTLYKDDVRLKSERFQLNK